MDVTLGKSCGGQSGRISPGSASALAAGWKDDRLVIATVTQRSGSRARILVGEREVGGASEVGEQRNPAGAGVCGFEKTLREVTSAVIGDCF